jgi:hypothetical protein
MKPICNKTWEACQVSDDPEMYDDEIIGEDIAKENRELAECEECSSCKFHPKNATFGGLI